MSTTALPEREEEAEEEAYTDTFPDQRAVSWIAHFTDGTSAHSSPGTWWFDIARIQEVDGVPFSLTTKPVKSLSLYPGWEGPTDERIILEAPSLPDADVHAFAFTRYAQSLSDDTLSPGPHLLYTAFGYVLPEYVYLLTIDHASHNANRIHTLLPRSLTTTPW